MYAMKLLTKVAQPSLNMRMVVPVVNYGSKKTDLTDGPPKKPLSPYMEYYVKNFSTERAANPHLKVSNLAKLVASKWAVENKEFKTKMMTKYVEGLSKYYEATQSYQSSLSPEKLTEIKEAKAEMKRKKEQRVLKKAMEENNKPKRPATSFGMFVKEQIEARGLQAGSGNQHPITETTVIIANDWKKLSIEAKQRYAEKFQVGLEDYKKKLLQWEDEMVRQGKGWLVKSTSKGDPPAEEKKKVQRKKQISKE